MTTLYDRVNIIWIECSMISHIVSEKLRDSHHIVHFQDFIQKEIVEKRYSYPINVWPPIY